MIQAIKRSAKVCCWAPHASLATRDQQCPKSGALGDWLSGGPAVACAGVGAANKQPHANGVPFAVPNPAKRNTAGFCWGSIPARCRPTNNTACLPFPKPQHTPNNNTQQCTARASGAAALPPRSIAAAWPQQPAASCGSASRPSKPAAPLAAEHTTLPLHVPLPPPTAQTASALAPAAAAARPAARPLAQRSAAPTTPTSSTASSCETVHGTGSSSGGCWWQGRRC